MNAPPTIAAGHAGGPAPRLRRRGNCRGYTLIELTLAIGFSLSISGAVVGVLVQHASFMRILSQFSFLSEDAPQINSLMSRLTSKAVSYRLYPARDDAFANAGAVNTSASAVRLIFRNPNGSTDQAVLAFETVAGLDQLNYYQFSGGWPAQANWTITSKAAGVSFADSTGILEMTLTGPLGEQITYSATTE